MAYTHFDQLSSTNGYSVGASGSEVAVIDSTGAVSGTFTGKVNSRKVATGNLGVADTGGGVISWANPEATSIIITRVIIDVTTASTGACTLDIGTTAASATTVVDNLIDGVDVGSAVITADNIEDQGTNGTSRQKLASGKWLTASKASGAAAGLAGKYYIEYIVL